MRRLGSLAQDLMDVLVRHFVLEHLDDGAPRVIQDERSRYLQRARPRHPAPKGRACPNEFEGGGRKSLPEIRVVDLMPRGQELTHERRFERSVELMIRVETGHRAIPQV